jgi:UDP-N-acetylmuramate dehydrogenase
MADAKLVKAFYRAAKFQIYMVENEGWHWTSNFLREYVRARYGFKFTNSDSPEILREVKRRYPEVAPYIDIKRLKDRGSSYRTPDGGGVYKSPDGSIYAYTAEELRLAGIE